MRLQPVHLAKQLSTLAIAIVWTWLLVSSVKAQGLWDAPGDLFQRLRQLRSPESVLFRSLDTHARSRQYPSGRLGWNVELVGLTGGAINEVVVRGSYAYCASGSGLLIFDISNPPAPALIGALVLPDTAFGIAVALPYAYVADFSAGLRVIDVSNPFSPREVGYCETPGRANKVFLAPSGRFAYVADFSGGLRVIDISNPAYPRQVGFVNTLGQAYDVFVKDSYAYLAAGNGGMRIIDISDSTAPREVGSYARQDVRDVVVVGSRAYVAGGSSAFVAVVDVSDPARPVEMGWRSTPGSARGIAVAGNYAYVANGTHGLRIFDISSPLNLAEVGFVENDLSDTWSVAVADGRAYMADGYLGLHIVDVSNPHRPQVIGYYATPGSAQGIAVTDTHAYVAGLVAGLRVLDLGDVAHPREVARRALPDWAWGVAVSGRYAYVAGWQAGLRVVDILSPQDPREVGFLDTPNFACNVATAGPFAYVADGFSGLRVLDVSSPFAPVERGFVDTPNQAFNVFVSGSTAYVADVHAGLRIIDVSNPDNPREIGFYDPAGAVFGVFVVGSYAYLAEDPGVLRIVDISNPANPMPKGSISLPGTAWDVVVAGTYAYVATEQGGLRVIDVSDPRAPKEVGYFDTPGLTLDVVLWGDKILVANLDGGVFLLRFTGTRANRTPGVPMLIAPADGALVSPTPNFTLRAEDPDNDRVRFEIQVAMGSDTRSFLTDFVDSGAEMVYAVPAEQALPEGQWYWKVRAVDSNGAVSEWSESRSFTVRVSGPPSVPVLVQPVNNAVVTATPTFVLTATDPDGDRLRFDLELSKDGESRTFSTELVDSGAEATYTLPADQPLARGSWSWKARAVDEKGTRGEWSQTWRFTVQTNDPPAIPTLVSPVDDAVVSATPRFTLRSVDPDGDRVRFLIQVSNGADTQTYLTGFVASGAEAGYDVPVSKPLAEGAWTWKAQAVDETGATSDWSGMQRFTVRVDKPDLVPIDLSVSPAEVTTGDRVRIYLRVLNQGQGVAGFSRTRVVLSRSAIAPLAHDIYLNEFVTPTLGANQSVTHEGEAVIPVDLSPGTYYVWVTVDANNSIVQSNRDNDQSSVTVRVLPSVQVWLPKGVSTFGLSVLNRSVTRRGLGIQGIAMKVWEGAGGYRDVGEDEPLQPGRAYWFKNSAPLLIRLTGDSLNESAVIPLQPGWNLVSSPFSAPVAWRLDALRVRANGSEVTLAEAYRNGWIEDYAWGWQQNAGNPDTGYYVLVYDPNIVPGVQTQLSPWKGYWIYAHRACEIVLPPPARAQSRSSLDRTVTGVGRWTLPVTVQTGGAITRVLIGVSDGGRGLSVAPPPAPPTTDNGQQVEAFIERDGVPLAVDVRGVAARQQEWNLVVRLNGAGEAVHLRWENANTLPRDLSLFLVDETTGAQCYLRTSAAYRFVPAVGETERRFRLIAQRYADLPLRVLNLRASRTRGRQVSIQFSLSRAASIQAEVLDARGQRVAMLAVSGTRQPGQHTLVWQGVDTAGRSLPAGTYLVRVLAYDEQGRQAKAIAPVVLVR